MTVKIIVGNCLDEMKKLEGDSVHCAVSSPPYWGLRDYGIDPSVWGGDPKCEHVFVERSFCAHCSAWRGTFGLEPTPELFIEHLVEIFEEVRRILRPDGTLWLNLGDSYAGSGRGGNVQGTSTLEGGQESQSASQVDRVRRGRGSTLDAGFHQSAVSAGDAGRAWTPPPAGLKQKDLVGIPWMAAFALRAAGWWLRQDIVWHKPNPMPESTTDRCTKAHEYLFLLTKSERYVYDAVAISEEASPNSNARKPGPNSLELVDRTPRSRKPAVTPKSAPANSGIKANESYHEASGDLVATRNKRSVWTVATAPFAEAHFATFPPALIEPCIEAGTSERGCCVHCAAPWERITSKSRSNESGSGKSGKNPEGKGGSNAQHAGTPDVVRNGPVITTTTLGWWPICKCDGLPDIPPYPEKPRRPEFEHEEAFRTALAIWSENARTIDGARKAMCDAEGGRKTEPATVLDPFGGAGTTGLVADRLQRSAVLIEMNPEYAAMARKRIDGDAPLFSAAE